MNVRVAVDDASAIGAARRTAMSFALAVGMSDIKASILGIIVTELSTNIVRHARAGSLLIQRVDVAAGSAVEVQAVDSGPGIADFGRWMIDGYSTCGTAGNGLGAAHRLADEFDLYSATSRGTAVVARVYERRAPPSEVARTGRPISWGYSMQEAPRESCNGDALAVAAAGAFVGVLVADGLGHGPLAAQASGLAASLFGKPWLHDLSGFVDHAHRELSRTRGAALATGCLDLANGRLAYLGIGNIMGSLVSPTGSRSLLTHNGTVGQMRPRARVIEYVLPGDGLLVMHSDGIRAQWRMDTYPGLIRRHPAVIAATLARDFRRGNDDSTVLVLRLDADLPALPQTHG